MEGTWDHPASSQTEHTFQRAMFDFTVLPTLTVSENAMLGLDVNGELGLRNLDYCREWELVITLQEPRETL